MRIFWKKGCKIVIEHRLCVWVSGNTFSVKRVSKSLSKVNEYQK